MIGKVAFSLEDASFLQTRRLGVMSDAETKQEAVATVPKVARGPRASTSSKNRTERSPSPYRSRNGQSTSELYVLSLSVLATSFGREERV